MVAPPGVVMIQAACPHQVAVVAVAAGGAAGGGGCFPGTTGGANPGLSAMTGAGGPGGGPAAATEWVAGAFLSGTANSTSAAATDTAPASSRGTHTIDERIMTTSLHGV